MTASIFFIWGLWKTAFASSILVIGDMGLFGGLDFEVSTERHLVRAELGGPNMLFGLSWMLLGDLLWGLCGGLGVSRGPPGNFLGRSSGLRVLFGDSWKLLGAP